VLAHNSIVRAGPSTSAAEVRNVGVGVIRVTFTERVERDGAAWLHVNDGEWVRADLATLLKPSAFRGVEVRVAPARPFGWAVAPAARRSGPGGAGQGRALARYDFVEVMETARGADGRAWLRLADGWVPADSVAVVDADPRPAGVGPDDFWVEVDLAEQTFAAYEGDRMVYAGLVSSGLDQKTWPTRTGLFSAERRVRRGMMQGDADTPDYYSVEDVPNALYFDGATALHGAYWHDVFGGKKSHGCVNLPPGDAAWVFRWSEKAPRPLRVWVHAPPAPGA
jgi:lipoprotein-anchoring transpeptidase ErfK/SrfK